MGDFANKKSFKKASRCLPQILRIHHSINVKIADLSPDGVMLGEAVQQRGAAQAALPLPPEELYVGVDQELGQQHALLGTHRVNYYQGIVSIIFDRLLCRLSRILLFFLLLVHYIGTFLKNRIEARIIFF